MKPIVVLEPARQEMIDAAKYYELQAPGLGHQFLDKIESAMEDLGRAPDQWPVIRHNIRRRLIHRFPFGILYRIDADAVVILAVMHTRQHPNYWFTRM